MPGARSGRTLVHPAGDLDERAQADDGLVPPQLAGPGFIVERIWEPLWATGRAGELPDLFRRGRLLVLQGVASTLADRLATALTERAGTAGEGARIRAVLDEISVGAVADSAGMIHRRGEDR